MSRRPPLAAVLCWMLLAWSPGGTPATAQWTVDDLVTAEEPGELALAPDGSFAIWIKGVVTQIEGEERRVQQLWMTPLGSPGADAVRLTRGAERLSTPKISPDGRRVAFVTDREPPAGGIKAEDRAKRQVWVLPLGGGEPYPATTFDRDVQAFDWTGPESLLVAAAESPSALERAREEGKDTAVVVEDPNTPPVRLFTVDLSSEKNKVRRLGTHPDWVDNLAVSPDGSRAVVSAQQSLSFQFDAKTPPTLYLLDVATGARTRLDLTDGLSGVAGRAFQPYDVKWALDGSGFYFVDAFTNDPLYRNATVARLYFHAPDSGRFETVDADWERGLGRGYAVTRDGVVALLADGVRYRPARLTRTADGWRRADLTGTHVTHLDRLDVAADGRTVLYETSSATVPPQIHVARLDGSRLTAERKLTDLNPDFAKKPTGRVDVIRWTGALGDEVEGLLHYPLDWKDGETGRRPLLLDIHGGPAGTDRDSWDQRTSGPNLLYRQRGAFVLQVNYHGSAGYGLEWVESIAGRYYELEIPDIEAGVDHVLELGLADPERLATYGWSNGGILSADLITRTGRYRAASIGAADVEWISDWANVDFGASFDNYYFGGPPWEIPEVYIEKSPFFRLDQVTTPTLIHTGTEDRNVPPHQSWSLFRALQQLGNTETRLVLYPGEPHGLRKIAHQRRKIEEDLAWFDEHLFGRERVTDPAVPEDSPLASLLERARAERHDGLFGTRRNGLLVPEMIEHGDVSLGRFEVTRAQWSAFRPDDRPGAGDGNLPVTGISFGDARAYVHWLSEATGDSYRLPTESEAESWAGKGGNTLDRWAGYTPNPEDRERLLAAAEAAVAPGGAPPLLLPVGTLPGKADAPGGPRVFDLDGNAAEWAVGEDGLGIAVGPSAERSGDARTTVEPLPAYTGLRVVLEARK